MFYIYFSLFSFSIWWLSIVSSFVHCLYTYYIFPQEVFELVPSHYSEFNPSPFLCLSATGWAEPLDVARLTVVPLSPPTHWYCALNLLACSFRILNALPIPPYGGRAGHQ